MFVSVLIVCKQVVASKAPLVMRASKTLHPAARNLVRGNKDYNRVARGNLKHVYPWVLPRTILKIFGAILARCLCERTRHMLLGQTHGVAR